MAKKKIALLGCPSYGELSAGAARGLYRAATGKQVAVEQKAARDLVPEGFDWNIFHTSSSLLAFNMNLLWCWALNEAHKGKGCDYFAMIHADIEPKDFWLDTLIEELEDKHLDVLGVVAPIKDSRGVTSTAMQRPDGNNWRVHGRLTMKEVHRLPETFTSEDLGFPLLINTGLWVCKFSEEWAKKVHFTINDRIVWNTRTEIYMPEVEPEDWFISRLFNELGLRVGCTRKVQLGHRGPMVFGNATPWGNEHFDSEYLPASVLEETASADWFPHLAVGWLTENEGRELAKLAEGKTVLEVGSFCGRSTVCLAQQAKAVYAVDTFDGRGTAVEGDTLGMFKANMIRYGVADKVMVLQGTAAEHLPNLPAVFDLIFIDGLHDYESVKSDIELASNCLKPSGLFVFHDYKRPGDEGVTEAVNELLESGGELLSRRDSLAVVRPPIQQLSLVEN